MVMRCMCILGLGHLYFTWRLYQLELPCQRNFSRGSRGPRILVSTGLTKLLFIKVLRYFMSLAMLKRTIGSKRRILRDVCRVELLVFKGDERRRAS